MTSDEEAGKAIIAVNGASVGGRAVIVNEARPKAERGGGRGKFKPGRRDERR